MFTPAPGGRCYLAAMGDLDNKNILITGASSGLGEGMAREFAARPGPDADLRLKLLEFTDALERTVRIRERFAH